jgi:CubicO group peptidase (beta-lactamase class C family)
MITASAPGMQHICFSVKKPITATLAGILIDLGRFDANDLATKYLPEAKGSAYDGARIRHLLDVSVGITYSEDYQDPYE